MGKPKNPIIELFVNKFPNTLTSTLSKQIFQEHPNEFKSVESVRSRIRYMRGAQGKAVKRYATNNREQKPISEWIKKAKETNRPLLSKVLVFDIETSPFAAYSFRKWDTNISDNFILADWNIICWSAKWLFEDKVFSMKITDKEQLTRNDKRITKGLWKMLDEADIIIAHNLKKFDKKMAQTRFLKWGLFHPSHSQEIDTLVSARKEFKITSNALDYIATKFIGIPGKLDNEKDLWLKACGNPFKRIKPDQRAIDLMSVYCNQDVLVLEDVYLFLRPYITNHPNLALFEGVGDKICKACGGKEFLTIGDYTTIVNRYEGFRCKSCGSVHRSRRPSGKSQVYLR